MGNTNTMDGRMVLFINGEEAVKNMEVTTFRNEKYILTGWRAPGEIMGGQNGKVYCKNKEDFEKNTPYSNEWYPGVIGGEFRYVPAMNLPEDEMKIQYLKSIILSIEPKECAIKHDNGYVIIQECTEGFDYTILNPNFEIVDGGIYDDFNVSIFFALNEALKEANVSEYNSISEVNYEAIVEQMEQAERLRIVKNFKTKTEQLFNSINDMSVSDIEDYVKNLVQEKIYQNNFDAEIKEVVLSGSRCRGLENESSDLDVVVEYIGNEREDDMFNMLHEDDIYLSGIRIDINPICEYTTGTLEEYLPEVEKYLSNKAVEEIENVSIRKRGR